MDPLDDLFAALRVRSALMARIEGRGAWGLAKTGGETARYGLVARGRCLLEMEGQARPVQLEQGDCFLVPHGTPYVLRDAPWTPPVSCRSVTPDARSGVVELGTGSGAGAVLLCGWFHFEAEAMRPLAHLLPPLLHVKMDSARAEAMQGTLQLLSELSRSGKHVATLADELRKKHGDEDVIRKLLGMRSLVKKYGGAAVDEASGAVLDIGVCDYSALRRYLERRPAPPLSLAQIDPLIRQLSHYRELIDQKTEGDTP